MDLLDLLCGLFSTNHKHKTTELQHKFCAMKGRKGKREQLPVGTMGFFPPKIPKLFFHSSCGIAWEHLNCKLWLERVKKRKKDLSFKQVSLIMSHNAQIYLDINKQLMKSLTVNSSKVLQIFKQTVHQSSNKKNYITSSKKLQFLFTNTKPQSSHITPVIV